MARPHAAIVRIKMFRCVFACGERAFCVVDGLGRRRNCVTTTVTEEINRPSASGAI